MNGHCSTDGADSKAAATRPEEAGCDSAAAGENGKHGACCGDQKPGGHAISKANGHASGCPAEAWQREEAAATASEDGNESDRGTGTHGHRAGGDGVPDDKGATPETTPAGSDRAGGSPSCQTSEAHPKDDASSESAANTHIHSLADSSSAETSAPANVDAPAHNVLDAATSEEKLEGGKGDVAITPSPPDRCPSGDGEKPDDRPATGTDKAAWKRSEPDLSSVDTPLSSASCAPEAVDIKGMHTTAAPTSAAQSKPCKDDEDDEQLVASLIAVAHNTVHENGDAAMADADRAGTTVRAFALSDVGTSSSSKSGHEPSAADKVIMATLLGLSNCQKAEDVTGSENGDDDDDDASGQGSSSRPDAGSDNDDMDEDSKAGKDSKTKGPGKRGPKKKRDKEGADGKTEGDDKDDDPENDAESSDATKSARKAKKEADGDEPKPRGRKGKKQVDPFPRVVLPLHYATDAQFSRDYPNAVCWLMCLKCGLTYLSFVCNRTGMRQIEIFREKNARCWHICVNLSRWRRKSKRRRLLSRQDLKASVVIEVRRKTRLKPTGLPRSRSARRLKKTIWQARGKSPDPKTTSSQTPHGVRKQLMLRLLQRLSRVDGHRTRISRESKS